MNPIVAPHPDVAPHVRLRTARFLARQIGLLLVLLVVSGCGQEPPPATVEGVLRIVGRPLDNCLITFFPEPGHSASAPHSIAVTNQSGFYRLHLADQREGASVGWHHVTVQDLSVSTGVRRRDHGAIDADIAETAPVPVQRSRTPDRYASSAGTPLRIEIKPGSQVIDLDIE